MKMLNYIIQPGDTLYKISQMYGVTVQEIVNANPNVNPYNLYVGQIIQVPSRPFELVQQYQRSFEQIPLQRNMPTRPGN